MRKKIQVQCPDVSTEKGCIWMDNLCGVIETGGVYEIIYRGGELVSSLNKGYKIDGKGIVKVDSE